MNYVFFVREQEYVKLCQALRFRYRNALWGFQHGGWKRGERTFKKYLKIQKKQECFIILSASLALYTSLGVIQICLFEKLMMTDDISTQDANCEVRTFEAEEEDLQSEVQTKNTDEAASRLTNHENEDVDFLPAGRIIPDEDKEADQSTSLPKIEEESSDSDQEPKPEPERLLKSSEKGIIDHVVWILDKEPSLVNCRDSDGYTPLHRACYNGHMNVVRVLLQRGADVDARTEDGWQPLHCACRWGEYIALNIYFKRNG